jgi:hypothetical protein
MNSSKIYQVEFEKSFLQQTKEFYQRESSEWLNADSTPEYLRKAEIRFQQEKQRLIDYLQPQSEAPLIQTLNEVILVTNQTSILEKENTGVAVMLQRNDLNDLNRMYSLYSNIQASLPVIGKILYNHIVAVGQALIERCNTANNVENFIEELMKLHEHYASLVSNCFKDAATFHKSLKESFELLVNKQHFQTASTAELLATYADNCLKKGGIRLTEKQLDVTLDNIVKIFSYLGEKDLFAEFYRKQLASRLLMQRSASNDAEKSMIGKLKLKSGAQFTSKFEGMINDIRNAAEHSNEFNNFLKDRGLLQKIDNIEFTVQTLTTGHWPCLTVDHELLTHRGWLPIHQIQANSDRVLTLHPQSLQLQWQTVQHHYVFDYEGELYRLYSDELDAVCTVNHRWLCISDSSHQAQYSTVAQLAQTQNFISSKHGLLAPHCRIPQSGINMNLDYNWISVNFLPNNLNSLQNISWCELIGVILASNMTSSSITLKPTTAKQHSYISQLIASLELHDLCCGSSDYCFTSCHFLQFFFHLMQPNLSAPLLAQLSQSQAAAIITGFVRAQINHDDSTGSLQCCTESVAVKDVLSSLSAAANFALNISSNNDNISKTTTYSLLFQPNNVKLGFCTAALPKPIAYTNPLHDGKIYSLSVANGNYYVRRAAGADNHFTSKQFFTGNSYPLDELELPPLLNECLTAFKVFYDTKTSNRKLRWIHDLGIITLAANFPKRKVDLILSTVQATILLLFNEQDSYTINELIDVTGLEPLVMKDQLKQLVNGKFKLLNKTPTEGYSADHKMSVNLAFQQALRVIRIPNAVRKTTHKDRAAASAVVSEDRKHAIEAAIVRVMKSRKTLQHNQLMSEVIAQLSSYFTPDPRSIKQRIEDLIQREYLERDKERSNEYHYLA